jgi:mannosyl-oligosaccharide alpha-1,2-mannosidase
LIVVFIICMSQFILLSRHVEIIEPGGDPRLGQFATNLSVLAEQQRKLSVLTAQLSANLQREHSALAEIKEQMNSRPGNQQAGLTYNSMADANAQEAEVRTQAELRDQGNSIARITQQIGQLQRKLEELQTTEARTAEAVRNQQAAGSRIPDLSSPYSSAGGNSGSPYSSRDKYEGYRNRPEVNQQHSQQPYSYQQPQQYSQPQQHDYGQQPQQPSMPQQPYEASPKFTDSGSAPRYDGPFPAEWLTRFSQEELTASATEANKWLEGAKAMFKHTWKGYRERAWGQDELRPVTGQSGRRWASCGLQILDALSTMWVMGMHEEFSEAERWVEESLRFNAPGLVSVFEITIRALGGLASAHSLSGHEVFLRRAKELADKLMHAFNEETGFPSTQVDLVTGQQKKGWYQGTVLAEAGTLQLEFRYISQQTGDPKYAAHADRSMRNVLAAAKGRGLVPWGLSKAGPPHFQNTHITFGAMGDSYYEYLLKVYLQTGRVENEWKDGWLQAMREMKKRLIFRTRGGLTYVAEEQNGRPNHKMDHLACFSAGMLIYGARTLPKNEVQQAWEKDAADITETCYQMYHRMPSHLSPECVRLTPEGASGQDMMVWNNAAHYLLRPEAAEAIFYMFYYTGDPKYRRMAGEILEAIETHAKAPYGYSAVADVRTSRPRQKNEMETFFVAETLKYLYLTFVPNPRAVLDLDEFVFTTEAHPIRVQRASGSGFLSKGR